MINLQAAGLPGEGRDGKNVVGDEAEWMSRQYLLFCLCLIFFITNVSHNYMPLFSQFSTLSSNNRNTGCNDSCRAEGSGYMAMMVPRQAKVSGLCADSVDGGSFGWLALAVAASGG